MAFPSPTDAVMSVGRSVGQYFSVVSFLPALMLVLWTYGLIASAAWAGVRCPHRTQAPCLVHAEMALTQWSVAKLTAVVLLALAVALFLHPLQFATTRLLEGYWGPSSLAVAVMTARVLHYRRQTRNLGGRARVAATARSAASNIEFARSYATNPATKADGDPAGWGKTKRIQRETDLLERERGDQLIGLYLTEQQATARSRNDFPVAHRRIMPTRLGNALRRFEDGAGSQYDLSVITVAPLLQLTVPDRHFKYLTDARQEMDTAIRLCLVSLLATVLTSAFLLRDGLWLLLALVPYGLAYVAYRGAVSSAHGYGVVVARVLDLNRFALYDELRMPQPADTAAEREQNYKLMRLLDPYAMASRQATLIYRQGEARGEATSPPSAERRA
jgi:hypothetical protein